MFRQGLTRFLTNFVFIFSTISNFQKQWISQEQKINVSKMLWTYLVRSSKGLVSLESLSSNDKLLNAPAVGPVISVFNFIVRTIDCNVSTNGLLSSPQGWEVKSNWKENLEKILTNSNNYVLFFSKIKSSLPLLNIDVHIDPRNYHILRRLLDGTSTNHAPLLVTNSQILHDH